MTSSENSESALLGYRRIEESDTIEFRRIRLLALQESPTAFGSSFEECSAQSDEFFARLIDIADCDGMVCGAWAGDRLCGVGGLRREGRLKQRHRAAIWGVYVDPNWRGRGIGHAIIERLLAKAWAIPGLTMIVLAVEGGNASARRLYLDFGFKQVGTDPMALQVRGQYFDLDQMVLRLTS